jgi:hypothetical protein
MKGRGINSNLPASEEIRVRAQADEPDFQQPASGRAPQKGKNYGRKVADGIQGYSGRIEGLTFEQKARAKAAAKSNSHESS